MQTLNDLEVGFQNDIDRIVNELIDEYSLKYGQVVPGLSDPLIRWLDFVLRYIRPTPRTIIVSNKFPKKLEADAERALHKIEQLIQDGGDMNPYQSGGLILHNDTSGNKKQQRTDLLWADWGIHHLHLADTPIANGSYFSDRSNWLLFCMVGGDFVGLIDVRSHGENDLFSDPDLIKTVAESWPEIMERYRLKGVLAPSQSFSREEVGALRKGGITSFLKIGNQVYMGPGMGLTSASTPTKVTMSRIRVKKCVSELAKMVFDPTAQFKSEAIVSGIIDPEFSLVLTKQGMAVYEKSEKKAFVMPRTTNVGSQNFLAELHDLVVPSWAMDFVVSNNP